MEKAKVDALVLSDPANFNYYTGYPRPFTAWNGYIKARPFMVIVPREGSLMTFLQLPYERAGRECTWVGASTAWTTLPFKAEHLADLLGKMGLADAVLALESGPGERLDFPVEEYIRLKSILPGATFTDSGPITQGLRARKSEIEIEVLKQVQTMSAQAFWRALEGLKGPTDERTLARKAKELMFAEGCDEAGFCRVIGLDAGAQAPSLAIWGGGILSGYRADVSVWSSAFADTSEKPGDLAEGREALREFGNVLKPGRTAGDVAEDCGGILRKHARCLREPSDGLIGHGIGLDTCEEPLIAQGGRTEIADGMVISMGLECACRGSWLPLRQTFVIKAGTAHPL
jgi:Xaa-Pro aminopeptidase